MTEPGQPGYAGPEEAGATDTLAARMVGETQDDQADSAALGTSAEPAADEDLSARAARLESELASVRAQAAAGETIRLKVEAPHIAFVHNGLEVGEDYTEVPARAVQAMMEAASDSGVKLTQEET